MQTFHYLQEMKTAWGWAERSARTLVLISRKWGIYERLHGLFPEDEGQPLSSPDPPSALKDLDPYAFMEWRDLTSWAEHGTINPDLFVMPLGDQPWPL